MKSGGAQRILKKGDIEAGKITVGGKRRRGRGRSMLIKSLSPSGEADHLVNGLIGQIVTSWASLLNMEGGTFSQVKTGGNLTI